MVKNTAAKQETWVQSLGGKIPWRRKRLPTPIFWPREFYGQRSCIIHGVTKSQTRLGDLPELYWIYFTSVQSLSHIQLFATPWIAACQASLSITNSRSSPRLMSIESVMPSGHLTLCRPLFLLSPIPPSIRVFSNESTLHMRWPKY